MTDKELTDFIEHGENGFVEFALTFGDGWAGQAIEIAKELRAALTQPEPWSKELPPGTTHISSTKLITTHGGLQTAKFYAFKYEDNCLLVYTTDNDNEYPHWALADKQFKSIPKLHSIYAAALAQPEKTDMQIGLTYEEANPPMVRTTTPEDIKKIERKWHAPVAWMWDINNGAGYSSRGIGFEQTNIPFAKHTPLYTAPPQPEPVAWVDALDKARPDCVTDFKYLSVAQVNSGEHLKYIPLYTAALTQPEPTKLINVNGVLEQAGYIKKKEWVGLTDEEIADMHHEIKVKGMGAYKTEDIYRAIEAKLKEKNT